MWNTASHIHRNLTDYAMKVLKTIDRQYAEPASVYIKQTVQV